ncbi:hypothetical protein [Trichoplusia ni ascovirus 2c]|uniref:hypothetical protein n=1 Tax=Trichoplusia ni ascovirus 2c TaxID=328615 RepID=UPI0000E4421B|nr:hypothetical protein TNAV2c_gp067 [Trichoplusia ni ascovirus 2c]ABF70584.1 hypothetical protein [Trichoplusia ni ascovirus 2c]
MLSTNAPSYPITRKIVMLNKYNDPISSDFFFDNCKTIVISGGGFKALYYMGVAHAIGIENMENFAGTSCGSAVVTLLSAGATPLEIFKRIVKKRESLGACNDIISSQIKSHLREIQNPSRINCLASLIAMANMFIGQGVSGFVREFGDFLQDLGYSKDITMAELKKVTGKNLAIVAAEIPSLRCVVFTAESFPDMKVVLAVSISCSLTWPHTYDSKYYMDGVYSNNFPVDIALKLWPKDEAVCICSENSTYPQSVRETHFDRRCHFIVVPLETTCGNGIFADNTLMFVMFHFAYMFVINSIDKVKRANAPRHNQQYSSSSSSLAHTP